MNKKYFIEKKVVRNGNSKAILLTKDLLKFLDNPEKVKISPEVEDDKKILKIFV